MNSHPNRIFLGSEFRQNGETPAQFTNRLQGNISGASEVQLSKFVGLNLLYPFKSSNNKFSITQSAVTTEFTISDSRVFSDGTDFATYLTSLVSGTYANIAFAYDADTNLLTVSDSLATNFSLNKTTVTNIKCLNKLGFTNSTLSGASSYTAEDNPILLGSTCLFIKSTTLNPGDTLTPLTGSKNADVLDTDGADIFSIITCVPLTYNYGDVVAYEPSNEKSALTPTSSSINNIDIQIYDDDYEIANLQGNAKITLEFNFYYQNTVARRV